MKKTSLFLVLFIFSTASFAGALIDADVLASMTTHALRRPMTRYLAAMTPPAKTATTIIIFAKAQQDVSALLHRVKQLPGVTAHAVHFMPAVIASIPKDKTILNKIAKDNAVAQISLNKAGSEELEISAQALMLHPSTTYPTVNNWWQAGYTGHTGVVGIIDSGIAVEHPGLSGKTIILNDADPEYAHYKNGVRTPHGTGVACIYAGAGSGAFPSDIGIAHGASTIVAGFAMEHDDTVDNPKEDELSLMSTLDWMLTRAAVKPTVINYSFGNGNVSCPVCTDWSGLAKIVDYVVTHEKILWVKSGGNKGFPGASNLSTLTSPADNYNALTVANMNPTVRKDGLSYQTADRAQHAIRYTSSRGPTLNGRRKPDITAPGNDTRTCAPDDTVYPFTYTSSMNFHDGYRLMGGTSSAAPHVGGAILLLQDAGIRNPIAAKALLLNSADAWTDNGVAGPEDPQHPYQGGHAAVMGSEWNPTYGWGYMNMQKAFDQRSHLVEERLTTNTPVREYKISLPIGGKVTLVHERRVGYNADNTEWRLSHLSLELYDADTLQLLAADDSAIDTVHQIANCVKHKGDLRCSDETKTIQAIVRVKLLSAIEGSDDEPFALVYE
ncbi:MAG: protease [Legionella sp.]|nr:MAG: protease [Legionella sp.]